MMRLMMNMEKLLTVLSEVRADIDYRETDDLIDGGYFESIDIISCIAAIEDAFDISIEPYDITPENFNSAEAMWKMISQKLN